MSKIENINDELKPTMVITGSISSGFEFWGPFESAKQAYEEFVNPLYPFMTPVIIQHLKNPEDFPVKITDEPEPPPNREVRDGSPEAIDVQQ